MASGRMGGGSVGLALGLVGGATLALASVWAFSAPGWVAAGFAVGTGGIGYTAGDRFWQWIISNFSWSR